MTKKDAASEKDSFTSAHEDYLKAIYLLDAQGQRVNNSALAGYLRVSPASATNMVKKLGELDLVEYTPYQSISLTPKGQRVALEVLRHHRLLELYLHDKLNLTWDQVHAEAERLEHVLSDVLEDAIAHALGNPTVDPHGDPIPSKEGHVETVVGMPLSQAPLNRPCRLVRVLSQDEARLAYLGDLGLYPNAVVTVLARAPFDGPLEISVNHRRHSLAYDMANTLLVIDETADETLDEVANESDSPATAAGGPA